MPLLHSHAEPGSYFSRGTGDIIVETAKYSNLLILTNLGCDYISNGIEWVCEFNPRSYSLNQRKITDDYQGKIRVIYYLGHVSGNLDLDDWYECYIYLNQVYKKYRKKIITKQE